VKTILSWPNILPLYSVSKAHSSVSPSNFPWALMVSWSFLLFLKSPVKFSNPGRLANFRWPAAFPFLTVTKIGDAKAGNAFALNFEALHFSTAAHSPSKSSAHSVPTVDKTHKPSAMENVQIRRDE
jgi:hypothetical protein